MMKIQILSDLHLEFAAWELPPTEADVLAIAGDLHLGEKGYQWLQENVHDKEVIYVLGNHEFYKAATPKLIHKLQQASKNSSLHILENNSITVCGVRFLGCTLWTDFNLTDNMDVSMASASLQMSDYHRIRISPKYMKIQPSYTVTWHRRSVSWLRKELEVDRDTPTVVVTHHAPSSQSVDQGFISDPLSAAYASNLDEVVSFSSAKLWIHGHLHNSADYTIGDTRVLCNPRGYADEPNNEFRPDLVVDV